MSEVIAAHEAYKQAQDDAKALLAQARIRLGRAIHDARRQDKPQEAIAGELDLTRERLRLFQREYEKAATEGRASPSITLELAMRISRILVEDDQGLKELAALLERTDR